jgi:hypothetical protein
VDKRFFSGERFVSKLGLPWALHPSDLLPVKQEYGRMSVRAAKRRKTCADKRN